MHIYVIYIFFEEVGITFRACDVWKNGKGYVINAVANDKSVPFSKISPFFKLFLWNRELFLFEKLRKRLVDDSSELILSARSIFDPIGFKQSTSFNIDFASQAIDL